MKAGWRRRAIRARAGFTLIELMVVLIVIGIMAAVVLPDMRGTFDDARLRSTTRRLADALNLAYSQAVTRNQPCRVRLDTRKAHYALERTRREGEQGGRYLPLDDVPGAQGELDSHIKIEWRRADDETAAVPPSQPRRGADGSDGANAEEKSGLSETITFYPDGTADSGEIVLRDPDGFRLALRINPTTARIRVVEIEHE
jgi:type II secretion system protein H